MYTSDPVETDDTPSITANGDTVHSGGIACPSFLPFGTKVIILDQAYTCNDRMAKRYRDQHYYDIWVQDKALAMQFGRQVLQVTIINQ